jgi:hypothetical protein
MQPELVSEVLVILTENMERGDAGSILRKIRHPEASPGLDSVLQSSENRLICQLFSGDRLREPPKQMGLFAKDSKGS